MKNKTKKKKTNQTKNKQKTGNYTHLSVNKWQLAHEKTQSYKMFNILPPSVQMSTSKMRHDKTSLHM